MHVSEEEQGLVDNLMLLSDQLHSKREELSNLQEQLTIVRNEVSAAEERRSFLSKELAQLSSEMDRLGSRKQQMFSLFQQRSLRPESASGDSEIKAQRKNDSRKPLQARIDELESQLEKERQLRHQVEQERAVLTVDHQNGHIAEIPKDHASPREADVSVERQVHISNISQVDQDKNACACGAGSIFGNKDHFEFYLPKIGVNCTCGKQQIVPLAPNSDPKELQNILRDWQIQFLLSIGITDTCEFIAACEARRMELAQQLKDWRKSRKMPRMKIDACAIAVYIWARTCRAVTKVVDESVAPSVRRPEFMDVCVTSDAGSVSTLGTLRSLRAVI